MKRDRDEATREFAVPVETLDGVMRRFGIDRVDLLKVDVEGAEGDLLRGSKRTLVGVDRVVLEYHSHVLLEECAELLESAQFLRRSRRDPGLEQGIAYFSRDTVGPQPGQADTDVPPSV